MATPKEIIFEQEARDLLFAGLKKIADVVAVTLGPSGRNVGLDKSWGAPTITNDGNSIVNNITLKNQYENMGVSLAKEVAQKIKEKCGDGTTTGILLLHDLARGGIRNIASGASPIGLKRGMEKSVEAIEQAIHTAAIPLNTPQEIRSIAIVSASGNEEVGNTIAEAIEKSGRRPEVITLEEGKGTETIVEMVEGMQFDRGTLSNYFCTNNQKMTVELHNPLILLADKKISSIQELLPILQQVAASGKELLIIAEDIEGDALSTLVINKLRGTLKVAAVKAPGFGDNRKAMMQDLAVMTGATLISEEAGVTLKDNLDLLGQAEKVTINKENTILVNGGGSPEEIKARIKQIDHEIAKASNKYDREKLEGRRAKLSGKIIAIKVGAATEPELKQKMQAYEDSLSSTKAALAEGIVPGGGVTLLHAREAIKKLNLKGDEAIGGQIVYVACEAPLKRIAFNAGVDGSVIVAEAQKAGKNIGFNALSHRVEDLMKAGVIDPALVVKSSLKYAASVAGIFWISEVLIGDAPEEEEDAQVL